MNFSIVGRIKSVKHALNGLRIMIKYEHNAWVHLLATTIVCIAGFHYGLKKDEWCWVLIAILLVWAAEALNTAFEFLADVAVPDFHPMVEKAKDVSAGAVLIASIGAVIIGSIVFYSYIFR